MIKVKKAKKSKTENFFLLDKVSLVKRSKTMINGEDLGSKDIQNQLKQALLVVSDTENQINEENEENETPVENIE